MALEEVNIVSILVSIASIITAVGGWRFIRFIMNRNAEKREKEMNLHNREMQHLRDQIDWMYKKYEAVSKKLDDLYVKFRLLEEENIKLLKENSELKVALQVARYNVCERPDDECIRRIPTRQKCRLKMLLNGTYEAEDVFKEEEQKQDDEDASSFSVTVIKDS